MSLLVAMVSPLFSMSSHGEIASTRPGVEAPSRRNRKTVAIAMLAPALSPTKAISAGSTPDSTRAVNTAVVSSSWAGYGCSGARRKSATNPVAPQALAICPASLRWLAEEPSANPPPCRKTSTWPESAVSGLTRMPGTPPNSVDL